MKKLFTMLLVLELCLSLLVSCGTEEQEEEEVVEPGEETTFDGEGFKVGFMYASYTDALGSGFKRADETATKAVNCEAIFVECADADAYTLGCENLIQAGVKGIVTAQINGNMLDACEKAGVYIIESGQGITDADLLAKAAANPYYVGSILEDNYPAAYAAAQELYDAGCRNFCYLSLPAGAAVHYDNRTRGFETFIADHPDCTLVTSWTGSSDYGPAAEQMLASYPEIDGVLDAFGNTAVLSAIYTSGRSDTVKYGCMNINEGIDQGLEDGVALFCCGGQYPTQATAFSILYNSIQAGESLFPDKTEDLYRYFIYVHNYDEYKDFIKYYSDSVSDPGYTSQDYIDLCTCNSWDYIVNACKTYSLDSVKAARG